MKKTVSVVSIVFLFWTVACAGSGAGNSNTAGPAQDGADRGTASLQMNGANVTVEYGRPPLRGQDPLQRISPGQEWRMGMNTATTLTTDADLKFGDKVVPKGQYILTAKLMGPEKWQMRIKREDQSVVAEVPLTFQKADKSVELVTIELKENSGKGLFALHWGNYTLSADFQKA